MKWQTTPRFNSDWKRLPAEHRRMFKDLVPEFSLACDGYVGSQGGYRWPAGLRVSPLKSAPGIWEMTWSFSGPDGRATFEFVDVAGETRVRWRRIGDHGVYGGP